MYWKEKHCDCEVWSDIEGARVIECIGKGNIVIVRFVSDIEGARVTECIGKRNIVIVRFVSDIEGARVTECIGKILQEEYLNVKKRKFQWNWIEQYSNLMVNFIVAQCIMESIYCSFTNKCTFY